MKDSPQPLPTDLKSVAVLGIVFGVLQGTGGVFQYFIGPVQFQYVGVLGIVLGAGLLLRWRLCRWCSIGLAWLYLISLPLVVLFFAAIVIWPIDMWVTISERRFDISGWTARLVAAFGAVLVAGIWVVAYWALRVLRRPDVRLLFEKAPSHSLPPTPLAPRD